MIRRKRIMIGVLGGLVLRGTALAQPDLHVRGALSLSGVQDDNLFSAPADSREGDFISRLTPEVEGGVTSARLSLAGRYSLDAERYSEHPELDTARARELASIDLQSRPARLLKFSLHGDYLSTLTPGDLNPTTGLSAGRLRARRVAAGPAVDWRMGPKTSANASCTLTRDDMASGIAAGTRTTTLGLQRRLSPRDTGSLVYTLGQYDFGEGAGSTARTVSLGWERRLGTGGALSLRGGPRYSDGRTGTEAFIALRHDSRRLHVSLTGGRSLATVIGRAGTVVSDSVLPAVSWQAMRSLFLSASPGVFRIRDAQGGAEARVYLVGIEADWRIDDRLSVVGTYRRSLQRGTLDPVASGAAGGADDILRDTFLLSLVARQGASRATVPAQESTP
jgi:hypothetical protein